MFYPYEHRYDKLIIQVKHEESLETEIDQGLVTPEIAHFLATHPRAYREHKEVEDYIKRLSQ